MELAFKPGDRVKLTPLAVAFYGGAWPHWIPEAQGGGSPGTVLFAGERPHKPGAAPRPYFVRWDSGIENSYRIDDLEGLATEAVPGTPDDPEEPSAKIIPFRPSGR